MPAPPSCHPTAYAIARGLDCGWPGAPPQLFTRAQDEADRLLASARDDAEAMRLQTEDYVDAKLANFEVVLAKTLATVERGRSRLSGGTDLDALRSEDPEDEP